MNQTQITTRTIQSLIKDKLQFFIPSYQRGYRWDPAQVVALLDDISEFEVPHDNEDASYWLQPVIVAPRADGSYEVIDGQQRLTTIFIILRYIKSKLPVYDASFSIQYESRPGSAAFLEQLNETERDENIDYYHMYEAYRAVENWFTHQDVTVLFHFYSKLTERTQVIWYEVAPEDDVIALFTRINMGKIPLTNSELVKALLLSDDHLKVTPDKSLPEMERRIIHGRELEQIRLKKREIAGEWDQMEQALQQDAFWYFLHDGKKTYATRIEWLLDAHAKNLNAGFAPERRIPTEHEPFFTFLVFQEVLRQAKDAKQETKDIIQTIWYNVKQLFMTFQEWYRDRTLYHLIGYLVTQKTSIIDLQQETTQFGKRLFEQELLRRIRLTVPQDVTTLDYQENPGAIRRTLLLFNIWTLLQDEKSNSRFEFDRFKQENWDIEHIHAVASAFETPEEQQKFLEAILLDASLIEDQELIADIRMLSGTAFTEDQFTAVHERIVLTFEESASTNHLSNLTLLDATTNRSYKNAPFYQKRAEIIRLDRTGRFIPLCTRNVFLKYYTSSLMQMNHWGLDDRRSYVEAIETIMTDIRETEGVHVR